MPRARCHWLVKSEAAAYGWSDLVADGETVWDGVRNPQARNHLAAMREGDLVLYYHSGEGKEVVGVARVTKEAYPDPKSADPRWLVVHLAPVAPLARPVALGEIKADPELRDMPLVRQSRLSVMPIERAAFEHLLRVSGTRLARR
jgi:predicted RNA-binding protein with PUA-like domain